MDLLLYYANRVHKLVEVILCDNFSKFILDFKMNVCSCQFCVKEWPNYFDLIIFI